MHLELAEFAEQATELAGGVIDHDHDLLEARGSAPCLPGSALDALVAAADRVGDRAPARRARRARASASATAVEVGARARSSTSTTGSAFAPRICTHSSGADAAMRVVSRTPWPASRSDPSRRVDEATREQARDQLRHVRDEGDRTVVLFGRHLDRRRAEVEGQPSTTARSAADVSLVAAHDPRPPHEDVGARGDGSAALAAGQRVRADVVREVDAAFAQRAQRLELDARDVGDDGVGEGARARAR